MWEAGSALVCAAIEFDNSVNIYVSNPSLQVTYPGYEPLTETVSVPYGPDRFTALTHNFQFQKSASTKVVVKTEPTCPSPEVSNEKNHSATPMPSTITAITALTLTLLTLLL